MILIRNLSLSFNAQTIFNNININFSKKQKIGLFGLNGAGKSTLLRIISGIPMGQSGSISISKDFKVGYLPQEVTLESAKSIFDETMSVFSALEKVQNRLKEIEPNLNDNAALIAEYAELCEQLKTEEPEKKRAECEKMLFGLGFSREKLQEPVSSLSTGWKMRIVLAKLLLQNADFYLFDEPTNHLDMVAKEWFLQFLKTQHFGFLLVCHEKYFLNQLCTQILELERGNATLYSGNYDTYIAQKNAKLEQLMAAYEAQQREIKEREATINRFRASASKAKMAQSMIKQLEKIERIEVPPSAKKVAFHFPVIKQSNKIVLAVKDLDFSYENKLIFQHCSFNVERGNRMAIVAPNGGGKTTLIKIISGKLQKQHGSISIGDLVSTAIFDQDQRFSLSGQETVLENAQKAAYLASQEKIRGLLGAFLFDKEAISKKASVLSGGEQNRLGMVQVLLQNANFLILDEPTNHLDIPSKEVLIRALQNYEGTILFVSHDHDFINQLATHILELQQNGSTVYHCNYENYLYQKKIKENQIKDEKNTKKEEIPTSSHVGKQETKVFANQHKKQQKDIENRIDQIEKRIKKTESSFLTLKYGTPDFQKAQEQLTQDKKKVAELTAAWENLSK